MRASWTHPCANCGKPCDMSATHCRTCMYALGTWRKKAKPLPPEPVRVRPRALFELYCLMCGRGVGLGGRLIVTPQIPTRRAPCSVCGGFLFVREVSAIDRDLVVLLGAAGEPRSDVSVSVSVRKVA